MNEIFVYVIDFETTKIKETVTENEDGTYSIFLNARHTAENRLQAYLHAVEHIRNNDFEKKNADIDSIEAERHKIA